MILEVIDFIAFMLVYLKIVYHIEITEDVLIYKKYGDNRLAKFPVILSRIKSGLDILA